MSTCISSQGEYSAHTLDVEFTCTRCHVLDEDGLRAELDRLKVQLSNYAHDRDDARAQRDKAERELKQQYDDLTKASDDAARSMNEKVDAAKATIARLALQHDALTMCGQDGCGLSRAIFHCHGEDGNGHGECYL